MGFSPGPMELMIVGLIALLLFGKRLPEVARSLGKGIVEFKKGVRGIEDEVNTVTRQTPSRRPDPIDNDQSRSSSAPRFEPPASEPISATANDADRTDAS